MIFIAWKVKIFSEFSRTSRRQNMNTHDTSSLITNNTCTIGDNHQFSHIIQHNRYYTLIQKATLIGRLYVCVRVVVMNARLDNVQRIKLFKLDSNLIDAFPFGWSRSRDVCVCVQKKENLNRFFIAHNCEDSASSFRLQQQQQQPLLSILPYFKVKHTSTQIGIYEAINRHGQSLFFFFSSDCRKIRFLTTK